MTEGRFLPFSDSLTNPILALFLPIVFPLLESMVFSQRS